MTDGNKFRGVGKGERGQLAGVAGGCFFGFAFAAVLLRSRRSALFRTTCLIVMFSTVGLRAGHVERRLGALGEIRRSAARSLLITGWNHGTEKSKTIHTTHAPHY